MSDNFTKEFVERELAYLDELDRASAGATGAANPIPLNMEQESAVKQWAADDRLWTTQETVEFNLRTFARVILKADFSNK